MKRGLAGCLVLLPLLAGCGTVRQALGVEAPPEPSIAIKSAETRWLLIKNPRFGDVPSEPEYVWVEDDKIPITLTTLVRVIGILRSEEHTSELQSQSNLVCRLLLEKKKTARLLEYT